MKMAPALGVIAAMVYVLPAGACGFAFTYARRRKAQHGDGHISQSFLDTAWFWLIGTVFFAVMAILRLLDIPETVRKDLKHWGQTSGIYATRREMQAELLICATLVVMLLAGLMLWRLWPVLRERHQRQARLSGLALIGMVGHAGLLGLRIVSLHAVDVMLYGTYKAGWVFEVVCSLLVMYAAQQSTVRKEPPRHRRRR